MVDVLRATTTMVTALHHGVKSVLPVKSVEECRHFQQKGYIGAAERGGKIVEGFKLGNSPFDYMTPELTGQKIVFTTTNGTKTIHAIHEADKIIFGAFVNLKAVAETLTRLDKNVVIVCAGWEDEVNLEDTLFAGAVVFGLKQMFEYASDVPVMAANLYKHYKNDLKSALEDSSHVRRLLALGLEKDIDFCLKFDEYKVIPVYKGDYITKMKLSDMLL